MQPAHVKARYSVDPAKRPRLVPTRGGYHILGSGGKPCGFLHKRKGVDFFILTLRGRKADLDEVWESGVLTSADL